jgi:hypothetical protein
VKYGLNGPWWVRAYRATFESADKLARAIAVDGVQAAVEIRDADALHGWRRLETYRFPTPHSATYAANERA